MALKLLSGSSGKGFYRLTYKDEIFYVNGVEIDGAGLKELISNLKGYLITEYIIAHEKIRKIYNVTPNTLKILLLRDQNKLPEITGGFMRFGTEQSELFETTAAGTIFTGVNLENGKIFNPMRFTNNLENLLIHPDTGEELLIMLPNWGKAIGIIYEISECLPQLSYLGFDIIITDLGFKIIEINSLSALTFLPYYSPFFENDYSRRFFLKKFKNNHKLYRKVIDNLSN